MRRLLTLAVVMLATSAAGAQDVTRELSSGEPIASLNGPVGLSATATPILSDTGTYM
jgi:hypothetical protein